MHFPKGLVEGKTIIVTGSSYGLGQYMALGLAHFGADIVVCSRNVDKCLETVQEIESMGRQAVALRVDVTKVEDITAMIDQAFDHFGHIDALINNAGTGDLKPLLEITLEEYEYVENINLRSTFIACQYMAKKMIAANINGKLINIASTSGLLVRPGGGLAHYAASKGGVIAMTKALAVELASYGIMVNCIAPGQFRTPLAHQVVNFPDRLAKAVSVIPLGRIGEAEDIIGPALFFASDLSDYVNGQTLFVDGGRTCC